MPKQQSAGGDSPATFDVSTATPEELIEAIVAGGDNEEAARTELLERVGREAALRWLEVADDPDAKLVAALAAAQGEYPTITKTKTGEVRGTTRDGKAYSYEYAYADLGDVLAAVRPVLSRHGLALVQRTTTDNGKVTLITELRHAGGGSLESVVDLGQSSGDPQKFGGALTYLRRYEAGTLLGVAPEEDTDARGVEPNSNAGGGRHAAPELPPWATDLSKDRLRDELGPRLKAILGDEGAKAAARTIRDNLGGIPAIVSMTAGLIIDTLLEQGDPNEVINRLGAEQERRRKAAQEAEVRAEAERQAAEAAEAKARQDAAEAPDPPAPEDVDETRAAAEDDPRGANDGGPVGATDEDLAKAAELPPAGKTPMPDISALTGLDAEAALRDAGCICDDPVEATVKESARNDQCPIQGHGIPF